jgi:hypothetical protein
MIPTSKIVLCLRWIAETIGTDAPSILVLYKESVQWNSTFADIARTAGRVFVAEFLSQFVCGHIAMFQYVLDDRLWSLVRNGFQFG